MKTPNILMVLADQHNAGLLGCAGHPQVRTPNLDRFAAESTRFTAAYAQNPICTPSRVSILSGQYCHNHGYYGLSGPTKPGLDNLMRHMRHHGYRTAAYGKLHLPNRPRNWLADDLDEFGDTYESADGEIGRAAFLDVLEGHGIRELEDSWHNEHHYGTGTIPLDAMPSELPYEHTQEMWSAKQAMRFIERETDKPFCIQIAFQRPHHPLLPQPRFWQLYPDDLALPPTFDQSPDHRPPHFRAEWHGMRRVNWEFGQADDGPDAGPRRAWRGTLACVSQVDDVFGMLLHYLSDHGLADNTIVIYGSDHGGYHGIHGIAEKAPGICSDAVCRVPMLWRVPGVTTAGTVSRALVENVDITPTLTLLCGLPPMGAVDGLDITPLLGGSTAPLRTIAVTENAWSKAVCDGSFRFVHYQRDLFGDDVGELYDLEADPDERINLYSDRAHRDRVDSLRRQLLEWLIATTRVTTTQPAVRLDDEPGYRGRHEFPVASDGTAPNDVQLRWCDKRNPNYS